MPFAVRFRPHAVRQIASWHLLDPVMVDVYLHLREDLAHQPAQRLERTTHPFDGMTYLFMAADRSNRSYAYIFAFQVKYGTDQETLWVVRGVYDREPL
jgi:hypothetical protein